MRHGLFALSQIPFSDLWMHSDISKANTFVELSNKEFEMANNAANFLELLAMVGTCNFYTRMV